MLNDAEERQADMYQRKKAGTPTGEIASQFGVGERAVNKETREARIAEEAEQRGIQIGYALAQEIFQDEAAGNILDLPKTDKDKFDHLELRLRKNIDAEIAERVRVKVQEFADTIWLPEHKKQVRHSDQMMKNRRGIMDHAMYLQILSALHPDSRGNISEEKMTRLFAFVKSKEIWLCNEKEVSVASLPPLPASFEEWANQQPAPAKPRPAPLPTRVEEWRAARAKASPTLAPITPAPPAPAPMIEVAAPAPENIDAVSPVRLPETIDARPGVHTVQNDTPPGVFRPTTFAQGKKNMEAARTAGEDKYQGHDCKHKHGGSRYVKRGGCVKCNTIRTLATRAKRNERTSIARAANLAIIKDAYVLRIATLSSALKSGGVKALAEALSSRNIEYQSLALSATPADRAERIRMLLAQAGKHLLFAGFELLVVRATVTENWEDWCRINVKYSISHVGRLMKLARSDDPIAAHEAQSVAMHSGPREQAKARGQLNHYAREPNAAAPQTIN